MKRMEGGDVISTQVDERDTQWELTPREFRVLIIAQADRGVTAYNLDDCSVEEAMAWSLARCGEHDTFALGVRETNDLSQPGLIWIVPEPD